jgi:hypothetical protein
VAAASARTGASGIRTRRAPNARASAVRAGEQAPDLGPRLALEDQPRAQADDSQPPLELVERALGGRLVAGVEAGRDALARPRLVDGSISVTRSSPASARTTLVPTLPVAPVTTIRIPAGYPSSTTSAE